MTYRINNREYGPSGLESHGALCEASCICMKDIFSKFDSSLCEKCQLKLSARAVGEIFVLHNVMISEFEYISEKKVKIIGLQVSCLVMFGIIVAAAIVQKRKNSFQTTKTRE